MSTRLKKPSILKQLSVTALLLAFQAYLGFSAVGGQFGIVSQKDMDKDIKTLGAQSATLSAEIADLKHHIALFNPKKLDPDILTEQARRQLSMAAPDELIIVPPNDRVNPPQIKNAY